MRKISFEKARTVWIGAVLIGLGVRIAAAQSSPAIRLTVDLREAARRIFHARLVIPAAPGPLTLVYPKWIPGEHGPTGPIVNLAGLKFTAAGKTIPWRRDDVDMYSFHCEVPAGATALEVELDYLSPSQAQSFTAGPAATAQLAVLSWNYVVLSPEGKAADALTVAATLRLPPEWKFGTALPVARQTGETVEFAPVSLGTLVDSPVLAGAHFRTVLLPAAGLPPHEIDMASDSDSALEMPPATVENFRQLVAEAHALFGSSHFRSYRFLMTLSDHMDHFGLEHHESSDDRFPERTLSNDAGRKRAGGLLAHEFVHSWNGKYRRPAGLATPDFEQPMKGDLLWGYEGLTQYLGNVLAARSGLWTPEDFRERLATLAATLDHRPGRTWRPLQDTAVAAQLLYEAPGEWQSWRRGTDFYDESVLIWLEADEILRRQTQGRRSLDDFCRLFHGGPSGPPEVKPYSFDDLVAALNEVAPYHWKGFFTERLNSTEPRAPLAGLEATGWRLVYTETPNEPAVNGEATRGFVNFRYSLGMQIRGENGAIVDAVPGMPAAQAGIAPGMKLFTVNGQRWSPELLRDALRTAKRTRRPIELNVENAGFYTTYSLNYFDGERYPHLERDQSQPDLLSDILRPRAPRGLGRR